MKQRAKEFRILLALVLALAMVAGNLLTVVAEPIYGHVEVINGEAKFTPDDGSTWTEIDDNLEDSLICADKWIALEVESRDTDTGEAKPSSCTVSGDVKNELYGRAVSVATEDGGTASAEITGTAVATDNHSYITGHTEAYAVSGTSEDQGSTTDIHVAGGATTEATTSDEGVHEKNTVEAYAVHASSNEGGSTTVTVDQKADATASIKSESDENEADAYAVDAQSDNGGTTEVTINGNASATANVEGKDPDAYARAVYAVSENEGKTTVTVNGDAKATAAISSSDAKLFPSADAVAVYAASEDGGTTEVTVTGKASASATAQGEFASSGSSSVFAMSAGENSSTAVTIGEGAEGGVEVRAYDQGTTELTIEKGGVTADETEDYYNGAVSIYNGGAFCSSGGTVKVSITGDIVATGSGDFYTITAGIQSENAGGSTSIEVKEGNITVESEETYAYGIYVRNGTLYSGKTGDKTVDFESEDNKPAPTGDYIALDGGFSRNLYVLDDGENKTYYVHDKHDKYILVSDLKVEEPTETSLTVTGDVTSNKYGVAAEAAEEQSADIIVDGTVNGSEGSLVLVNDTQLGKGVTMTVWAVEPDQNGAVVFSLDTENVKEGEKPTLTENKEAEAQLQYIIRVKAEQKDIIAAAGDAFDYRGYKVAHENDTVTLKLDIPDGYEVVEAYSDQAQSMKLEKNEKGEYFLTVPRGGAVELSVKLSKLPDPEPEPDTPDTVMITYVLDNGAQYDHIRMTAGVGEKISLQPAPEREGYTFLYWKGSDVDINSPYYKQPDPDNDFQFRPGASYTAKKDYNFVAVWKKN